MDALDAPLLTLDVAGSSRPAEIHLAPTLDGLYVPYALRTPADDGEFPLVVLAYGNGGGGLDWLAARVHSHSYITERLLAAGYACAWIRYRTEVDQGFHRGGPLVVDERSGMELMNRAPLEFEDELAILRHVRRHPRVDGERLAHVGVSHAGEMLFKLASLYPGVLRAGVAVEPANHEFLDLRPESSDFIGDHALATKVEEMQMHDTQRVRARCNVDLALERMRAIDLPVMVVGRDDDHLQGIFRLSYELLAESGKDVTWASWDHPLHGYVFPVNDAQGHAEVDSTQDEAIDAIISFLGRHLADATR